MDRADLPLDDDLAEIQREAQKVTDRETAARAELAAAIQARVEFRDKVAGKFTDVVGYIDNYVNPLKPNPTPIAPDVAAPAPAEEPPVFTVVDSVDLTPETTSGGSAPNVADELNVIEAPVQNEGGSEAGGAATGAGE